AKIDVDLLRRLQQSEVAFGGVEYEQPVAGPDSQSLSKRVRHSSSFNGPCGPVSWPSSGNRTVQEHGNRVPYPPRPGDDRVFRMLSMTDDNGGPRWGVVGTGGIAHLFMEGLRATPSRITAIGSRTKERARTFADTWGIPTAHGSYEELAQDPKVDVVYIATPHP